MKISTLMYTIKQGIINIFRNKWFSLASIATISACLFLFGIFYAIVANFQNMVKTAEEDVCLSVYFIEGSTLEQMKAVQGQINERDEVLRSEYVSADAAWEEFKKDYLRGYDDGFTENPMEGMDHVNVYMKDVSQQENLAVYIESMPQVDHVNRSFVVADTLTGVNKLIGYVSAGIIAILLVVSIFLISNTVAMGISVRQAEIRIMKYIGATDFFVRSPFVLEGMLIGLAGASIPLVLIHGIYDRVLEYMSTRFAMLSSLLNFLTVEQIFQFLTPASLIVGVGIGFLGSIVTVRKHLRV